jgi:hypothetical protein
VKPSPFRTWNSIWWWKWRPSWKALHFSISIGPVGHGLCLTIGVRAILFGFDWAGGFWERCQYTGLGPDDE